MARVREDKEREARDGFDGTWVAHPDLVPLAHRGLRRASSASAPNQLDRLREDVVPDAAALLSTCVAGGEVTEAGVRTNVSVALQYLDSWLRGNGAAAINNLMEDAATAEICRSQVWQWLRPAASRPRTCAARSPPLTPTARRSDCSRTSPSQNSSRTSSPCPPTSNCRTEADSLPHRPRL